MGKRVTIDNLAAEISKMVNEYCEDVADGVDIATKKTAQLGARALNAASGASFGGKKYRSSWTTQYEKRRLGSAAVIHSKIPGLPHLLEHGHASRGGGRHIPGKRHIAPIEQEVIEAYEREVTNSIEKAGS